MTTILFDDSLNVLVSTVAETLGEAALAQGVALRDATGLLCFASADDAPPDERRAAVTDRLTERLGAYARPDRVLLFKNDPGAQRLLHDPARLSVQAAGRDCWLIDRRIVGSGWLDAPAPNAGKPPRIVFASLKGGVGRSTALAVTAADLASRGRNVLVVDLDLEAPGLGELLLTEDRMPRFGVMDYLVENGIGAVPDASLDDFVGTSPLTIGSGGRVDVLPALGTRSAEAPQNVLPKLARAMIEDVSVTGEVRSVGTKISAMIGRFARRQDYDAILIDSRAGLAELAAPAVLGLGGVVLLFGTAQQQTIAGYRILFSALKQLAVRDLARGTSANWRLMFKPVYAKANLDAKIGPRHAADLYDLFAENLYDNAEEDSQGEMSLNFSASDPDAPHAPLVIPFDQDFVDFDSFRNPGHLANAFYEQTFRPFLNGLDQLMVNLPEKSEGAVG